MKRISARIAGAVLCLWMLPFWTLAERVLVPVGEVVGLELQDGQVTVAAFDDATGAQSRAAGLRVGDVICSIDGTKVTSAGDIRLALERSDGVVTVGVLRDQKPYEIRIQPHITAQGPKLGVFLRQGVTGIGTVTWYDPATKQFGTLGHGVNNNRGTLLELRDGNAYYARVMAVKKGRSGEPGQLMGTVEGTERAGSLERNTQEGVFGHTERGWNGAALPVAEPEEVRAGAARILSTVSGDGVKEYDVEILKIYPRDRGNGRNLLIRVTDPELLEATGGIVQGMSGSPIIQDGKLVGAVTHVLVNDPTTGYGIFIENMLDAAA